MTELYKQLARLDLARYHERFIEEGFESWETVLDITESDLEALGVKLGHRRILQKEIAKVRGNGNERLFGKAPAGQGRDARNATSEEKSDKKSNTGPGGKRKYRRHPKDDENAPERPPSAYVVFSNKIREELKPEHLSFTVIAKRVGERWQELSAEEKEPFELEASAAKEKYHAEMAVYKNTKEYHDYQQYLSEFKAKHASSPGDKRPKLAIDESTASGGSIDGSQADTADDMQHGTLTSTYFGPTGSGLSSPARLSQEPSSHRGIISTRIPLGTASPVNLPPSSSFARKISLTGGALAGSLQPHSSLETLDHVIPTTTHQAYHRGLPEDGILERTQQYPIRSTALERVADTSLSQAEPSSRISSRQSTQKPPSIHHTPSDSSSKSSVSAVSSVETAASSLQYSPPPRLESAQNTSMQHAGGLPHISTVSLPPISNVQSLKDASTKPVLEAPVIRRSPSHFASHSMQPTLGSSSSAGTSFDSLQLPLPYKSSFGSRPSEQSTHVNKFVDTTNLGQDLPQESQSLRDLTLQHERGRTPVDPQAAPDLCSSVPGSALKLPSISSYGKGSQDHLTRTHAGNDALHVLALAGNMVEKSASPPQR